MAATSLDNSLLASPSTKDIPNTDPQPQQIRHEKQYIDPNSMAHFKNNLQTLGNEFEKANRKLAFSTNTFQSELSNMNKNNIQSTIYPHNTSSRSLSPIVSNKIDNNNNNLLQTNASFPLPSNPKST
eukprot:891029_1